MPALEGSEHFGSLRNQFMFVALFISESVFFFHVVFNIFSSVRLHYYNQDLGVVGFIAEACVFITMSTNVPIWVYIQS